jgi:hypothetical protein
VRPQRAAGTTPPNPAIAPGFLLAWFFVLERIAQVLLQEHCSTKQYQHTESGNVQSQNARKADGGITRYQEVEAMGMAECEYSKATPHCENFEFDEAFFADGKVSENGRKER